MKLRFTLSNFLYFILFLSSSWDIFANIKLYGYSFRFFYFIEILLIVLLLFKRERVRLFLGHDFFVSWMFFLAIAIPNTTIFLRNVGYFIWLIFSYLLIILITNKLSNFVYFVRYFKMYIFSFICMSLFGFFQFILGLKGVSLLVTQWWIKGLIPRINGLSYEPSYYGTYMIGGVALLYWLTFVEKTKIFQFQKLITVFMTIIIILSSSRIAILSLFFVLLFHITKKFIFPIFLGRLNLSGLKVTVLIIAILLGTIILILSYLDFFKIFLTGTGLEGTPSHSVNERLQAAIDTFEVFLNNPIIGVSLGGIPSHRAELYGIVIHNQLEAKKFEGLNVLLEVLAASGGLGFIFFCLFFFNLFKVHFSLKRKIFHKICNLQLIHLLSIANSLEVMLVVEIFALLMSPNILRPYFWLSLSFYISCLMILRREVDRNSVIHIIEDQRS